MNTKILNILKRYFTPKTVGRAPIYSLEIGLACVLLAITLVLTGATRPFITAFIGGLSFLVCLILGEILNGYTLSVPSSGLLIAEGTVREVLPPHGRVWCDTFRTGEYILDCSLRSFVVREQIHRIASGTPWITYVAHFEFGGTAGATQAALGLLESERKCGRSIQDFAIFQLRKLDPTLAKTLAGLNDPKKQLEEILQASLKPHLEGTGVRLVMVTPL